MYLRFIDLADLRGVSLVELVSSSVIGRKYETFQLMLAQHSCNFILSRMFFEALTKNCSLDYLCCIDYTPYNQIYYTDENGTKVYLSDEEKKVIYKAVLQILQGSFFLCKKIIYRHLLMKK